MLIKVVLGWVNSTCSGQPHNIVNFVVKLALIFSGSVMILVDFVHATARCHRPEDTTRLHESTEVKPTHPKIGGPCYESPEVLTKYNRKLLAVTKRCVK